MSGRSFKPETSRKGTPGKPGRHPVKDKRRAAKPARPPTNAQPGVRTPAKTAEFSPVDAERPARSRPQNSERSNPFSPESFTVEGLAAVAEYVRLRPSALVEVRAAARVKPEVEKLLLTNNVFLPVHERHGGGDDVSPVVARVALKAHPFDAFEKRILDRKSDLVLALDHITDPRNLGAIVRTAAFFGVREILVPERRQVLLTQAAVHTAQGGFALTDLICVVNLARYLRQLKDIGYWIIGTDMEGEPYREVAGIYEKSLLVMGAEETGLSRNVRELCDRIVAISAPHGGGLESLNVSVAAGIMLAEFAPKKR